MCGILAITGALSDKTRLEAAVASLGSRGPDRSGTMQFSDCTLGHTILAIIDLEGGAQPMRDNAAPRAISYNGEIYNYRQLKKELEAKGHRFTTNSDTEVVLKAYAEYGETCVEKLDGMFALALWDDAKKTLFIARDRFGKKPLYYAYTPNGNIAIASEVKALEALGIKPEIDPAGIDTYLTLMYLPPWRTVYKNIHTLPPAHVGTFANGTLKTRAYWTLVDAPLSITYEEAKEETRRLLMASVQKRMIADVEIGAFLSGGVDSTLVTIYAQKEMSRPLKTFSLGYGDYINELPYANEAAAKIGTDHHTLEARANLIPELEAALAYFDEPHGDSADLAQHMLSAFTAEHVKVALAGDGGDELFMGYGWYWAYWNQSKLGALRDIFKSQFIRHQESITVFSPRERRRLFQDAGAVHAEPLPGLVTALKAGDAHTINAYDLTSYLPGQLLTKVDRMSMMHGLEVRCPLLDHELAQFAYNLPLEHKMNHHTGKFILKDLLAESMPRTFVDRKKQGFGAPVRKWLKEPEFRAYVQRSLAKGPIYEFLREDIVRPFVAKTLASDDQKSYYQLWVLLCLQIWLMKHYR